MESPIDNPMRRGGGRRKVFTRYDFTSGGSRPPPPLDQQHQQQHQQHQRPWDEEDPPPRKDNDNDHNTTITTVDDACLPGIPRVVSTDDQDKTILTASTARYDGDVERQQQQQAGGQRRSTGGGGGEDSEDVTLPPSYYPLQLQQQQQIQDAPGQGQRRSRSRGRTRKQPFTSPKSQGRAGDPQQQANSLMLVRHDVRVVLANQKVFWHSSAILQYASPVLSRHLVWKRGGHRNNGANSNASNINQQGAGAPGCPYYELDFKHRPALEWQWLEPFLRPHSQVTVSMTPLHVVHLLPWFLELQLDVLTDGCDRVLHSCLVGTASATNAAANAGRKKTKSARDINDLLVLTKVVLECQRRRRRVMMGNSATTTTSITDGNDQGEKDQQQTWVLGRTGEAVVQQWNDLWNRSPHILLADPSKEDSSEDDWDLEDGAPASLERSSGSSPIISGLDLIRSFVTDVLGELPERERHRLWLSMIRYLPPDLDVFFGDAGRQQELLYNPLFPYLLREGLIKVQQQEQQQQQRRKEDERRFVLVKNPGDFDYNYIDNDDVEECGQEVLLDPKQQQKRNLGAVQPPLLYEDWQESFHEWWNYWSYSGTRDSETESTNANAQGLRFLADKNVNNLNDKKSPCPDTLCPPNSSNSNSSNHQGQGLVTAAQGLGDLLVATVTAQPLPLPSVPPPALPTNRSEWLEDIWQHLQQPILPALPNHKDVAQRGPAFSPPSPPPPGRPPSSPSSRPKSPTSGTRPRSKSPRQSSKSRYHNKNDSFTTYRSSTSLDYSDVSSNYYDSAAASSSRGGGRDSSPSKSRRGQRVLRQYSHPRDPKWNNSVVAEEATTSTSEYYDDDGGEYYYDETTTDAEGTATSASAAGGGRDLIYDPAEGVMVSRHAAQRKFYC